MSYIAYMSGRDPCQCGEQISTYIYWSPVDPTEAAMVSKVGRWKFISNCGCYPRYQHHQVTVYHCTVIRISLTINTVRLMQECVTQQRSFQYLAFPPCSPFLAESVSEFH